MVGDVVSQQPRAMAIKLGATVLFIASFFVVKPIWHLLGIHGPIRMVFLLIPVAGMILFFRSVRWGRAAHGGLNRAVERYLDRFMACMLGYIAALVLAQLASELFDVTGLALALLRSLPAVPIIACVVVIGRYLVEEQDEFLRMQAARASLLATGLLLCLATLWGFLEQARLVAHVPPSMAFGVWGAGLGVAQAWQKVRNR